MAMLVPRDVVFECAPCGWVWSRPIEQVEKLALADLRCPKCRVVGRVHLNDVKCGVVRTSVQGELTRSIERQAVARRLGDW